MQREAENLNFEKAQILKERYQLIENFRTRSEVVSPTISNVDVFSIESDEKSAFINFLHITNGCINQAFTIEYKKRLDESDEELLTMGIVEIRERFNSNAREIILPFETEATFAGVTTITVPQKGEKRRLLSLSQLNVKQYRADRMKMEDKLNPEQKATRLMKEIQQETGIDKLPVIIECFDNSNIQGSDAVAACVVFKKLKPSKKDYRKYNIKTVEGPDDYASMREVVRRRYSRALEEGTPLPHLILADGGKGQMEVVRRVVEDELGLNISIAGLAKNDKHHTSEVLVGFPPRSIGLKPTDTLFKFLASVQDEVHRFAITFHRDKRSKSQTQSELDKISGVGEKTKNLLLKHFKSVKRISLASETEIAEVVGKSKASIIYAHFHPKMEP
jgi:excinuclease ABC subunit C